MIRAARREDVQEIADLCRLHAEYEGQKREETGQERRLISALFEMPPTLFGWVADGEDGGLNGYMSAVIEFATWSANPVVYMDCLYVREHARRKKLGREFINVLLRFAEARGIEQIQWQTPITNEIGIRFYHRIGATSMHKLRFTLNTTPAERARS